MLDAAVPQWRFFRLPHEGPAVVAFRPAFLTVDIGPMVSGYSAPAGR